TVHAPEPEGNIDERIQIRDKRRSSVEPRPCEALDNSRISRSGSAQHQTFARARAKQIFTVLALCAGRTGCAMDCLEWQQGTALPAQPVAKLGECVEAGFANRDRNVAIAIVDQPVSEFSAQLREFGQRA